MLWKPLKFLRYELCGNDFFFLSFHNNDESDTHASRTHARQRSNFPHVYRLINEYMEFGIEFGSVRFLSLLSIIIILSRQKKTSITFSWWCVQNTFYYYFFLLDVKQRQLHTYHSIIAMLSWMRTHNIRNQMLCAHRDNQSKWCSVIKLAQYGTLVCGATAQAKKKMLSTKLHDIFLAF